MISSGCPTETLLRRYVLGDVAQNDLEVIAEHVRGCAACLRRVESLGNITDPLLAALRSPAPEPATDPMLRRAVAAVVGEAAPSPQQKELGPGSVLREYRIRERLGAGGMGVVYRVLHTRLGRDVALKVLPARRTRDPEALARFEREMLAVGKFRHPHVVYATDAGEVDGIHFLVMEYVSGTDLARLVRDRGPASVTDSCEWLRQAALGLHHAHEQGLIHRDVKPSNLMLTPEGEVKVLDLGLALLNDKLTQPPTPPGPNSPTLAGSDTLTGSNRLVGTNDYMSPEQSRDPHNVDARADLFSLGCTLHYLLMGIPPKQPYRSGDVRRTRLEVPERLDELLGKLLAARPDERPSSAAEVAEQLAYFTRSRASGRRSVFFALTGVLAATAVALALSLGRGAGPNSSAESPEQEPPESSGPIVEQLRTPRPVPAPGTMPMSRQGAQDLQRSWAEFLARPSIQENAIGMRLALIPPGDLTVTPVFTAVTTRPFDMGVTEVTVAQFRSFVEATGHRTTAEEVGRSALTELVMGRYRSALRNGVTWQRPGLPNLSDDLPVVHVSWHDANAFCKWLTDKEGRKYRLPTVAEWRWACQAGAFFPMEMIDPRTVAQAAWDRNALPPQPQKVAQLKSNPWGLFDVMGNVEEWCADFVLPNAAGNPLRGKGRIEDPRGAAVGGNVWLMGGSYVVPQVIHTTCIQRSIMWTSTQSGFRVVRELNPE